MVDLTQILVALIYAAIPPLVVFVANLGLREIWPELVKYLGEKNAASLQARVNELLDKAIGFGVQKIAGDVMQHGFTIDAKNLAVRWGLEYANNHAADLANDAGRIEEKILARFDSHPNVQGLIAAANDNAAVPAAKAA